MLKTSPRGRMKRSGRSWQSIDVGLPAHAATLAIDAGNVLHAGTNTRLTSLYGALKGRFWASEVDGE